MHTRYIALCVVASIAWSCEREPAPPVPPPVAAGMAETPAPEPVKRAFLHDEPAGPEGFKPRIEAPQRFDWAPDDRPIWFHTVEESFATIEQWKPLVERRVDYSRVSRFGLEIPFGSTASLDKNLAPLREVLERPDNERPAIFAGLGAPFVDDSLHMFECPPIKTIEVPIAKLRALVYLTDELLVACSTDPFFGTTIGIQVLRDDSFPIEPLPHVTHTPQVSEKYATWWLDAMNRSMDKSIRLVPHNTLPPDFFRMIDVYFYVPELGIGAATQWYALSQPDFGPVIIEGEELPENPRFSRLRLQVHWENLVAP